MANFVQFDPSKQPRSKIELHAHLDGSVRLTTVWELAEKKGIHLPVKSLDELYSACAIQRPSTLANFLKPFGIFSPVIAGDPEAVERFAYEFCEDLAKQGVIYFEVRYCPHLLSSVHGRPAANCGPLLPRDVVVCVNRGLSRGADDFKLTARSILCCFRGIPEWSEEILNLCIEFSDQGVVGIDVAGDEALGVASKTEIDIFRRAAEAGVHRTVHAAEAGPAENAAIAVRDMLAERLGHGYHVVENDDVYQMVRDQDVHFEVCPFSSYLTGSVPMGSAKHPIVKFAEDNVSFSISRDDPTIIQKTLDEEYELLRSFGLKDVHFVRANLNAARKCFLPEAEKKVLWKQMLEIYGLENGDPLLA